jgi:hypothetical protein
MAIRSAISSLRCATPSKEGIRGRPALVWLVLVIAGVAAVLADSTADWAASPDAYFLTREERSEWKALRSRDLQEQFKITYWRRRDRQKSWFAQRAKVGVRRPGRLPPYLRTVPFREIAFLVEPGVRDEMQRPEIFERLHELVARHSIVSQASYGP